MKNSVLLPGALVLMLQLAVAADGDDFAAVPEPPDPLVSGQAIEPEITIIRRGAELIEEHRINGRLYMVKITPAIGKPYYLVDRNGDGSMESRMTDDNENFVVPQWVLFSW
jgi:hypothetical protein